LVPVRFDFGEFLRDDFYRRGTPCDLLRTSDINKVEEEIENGSEPKRYPDDEKITQRGEGETRAKRIVLSAY
jgi:hypothetical protein